MPKLQPQIMTAYYNEHDREAAEWLRQLIKAGQIADGEVDERDICHVDPVDLLGFDQCHFFAGIGGWSLALRLAGWADNRPVWTGSPPCQPYSVAGAGEGRNDARHLSPQFIRLVRAARPPVLFGEQVASAAVFGKVARKAGTGPAASPDWAWLDDLSDRLEAAHYAVGASDIPAAGVGAPNIRQRTFFGAIDLRSANHGLADQRCIGRDEGRHRDHIEHDGAKPDPTSALGGLGDCVLPGLEGYAGDGNRRVEPGRNQTPASGSASPASPALRPRPDNSFWGNADWLYCRDEKWRPVEPGTFPLADGVSGRVGLLRGYGNAINPWAASEFIQAFDEVTS